MTITDINGTRYKVSRKDLVWNLLYYLEYQLEYRQMDVIFFLTDIDPTSKHVKVSRDEFIRILKDIKTHLA